MPCPKCGHEPQGAAPECSRCGLVFARYRPRAVAETVPAALGTGMPSADTEAEVDEEGAGQRLRDLVLAIEGPVDPVVLAARALLFTGLVLWGWSFVSKPMGGAAGESFLHLVNLPFHEAGHILFMPFGSFLTSLGGSLTQVAVPLVCMGAILVRGRDPFGASVALWWAGENLLDLAPYVADARALQLVLLGGSTGAEVEGHDWEAVLGALGWLPYDVALGRASHALGVLVMLASLAWGGLVLYRQYGRLQQRAET